MMEQKIYFTACFLDLDGLKSVNDRYGHEEGDNYILTVTGELRRACRTGSDSLYRYGGDEFLVLFAGMPADAAENRAETVNGRLRSLQAEKSLPYPMSLSYGIVESKAFPDWKDLIQMADQKMYRQKQEKRLARTNEGEVK